MSKKLWDVKGVRKYKLKNEPKQKTLQKITIRFSVKVLNDRVVTRQKFSDSRQDLRTSSNEFPQSFLECADA